MRPDRLSVLRGVLRFLGFGFCLLFLGACSDREASTGEQGSARAEAVANVASVADAAAMPSLAGEWTLDISTPRGISHPVLTVTETDGGYSATYDGRQGLLSIEEITFDGSEFAFPLSITVPIGTIEVSYRGTIDGDTMTGVVENPRGGVPFSGQRTGG